MKSVSALVYYDGYIISSYEGIVFECPSDHKVIIIRKKYDANRACINLLDLFYRQLIYVGDGCVECDCMELKCNNDVAKINKGLIELNATFGHSLDKIFVLLHKPRKPRTTVEIIALMRDESVWSLRKLLVVIFLE
ncbi:hypothetical protein GmHk_06G016767 [Glycine max]|nr:hypothetical protein GmHk_06G016767 [Glycine max]